MSGEPLARKYRPKIFSNLIGQPIAVEMLQHFLNSKKIHPAILLFGMRGVGKTTLARLFAKSMSCEQGITPEPCDRCAHCIAIQKGEHVDVIEIDAASNTKVESVREILDNLSYAPSLGRYRIYIFDEVHMLSRHSFNALLKILEEPPKHVQFIFATTEPEKIPETVRSRLLAVRLVPVQTEEIIAHFKNIFDQESIFYEPESLPFLAQAAHGSVRDGLTIADQLLAQGKGKILLFFAKKLSEQTQEEKSVRWLYALHRYDFEWLSQQWKNLQEDAMEIDALLSAILRSIEMVCIKKSADRYNQAVDEMQCPEGLKNCLNIFSARSNPDWMRAYHIFLGARKDLTFAPSALIHFKMACLRTLHYWDKRVAVDAEKVDLSFQKTSSHGGVENAAQQETSSTVKSNESQQSLLSPIAQTQIEQTFTKDLPEVSPVQPNQTDQKTASLFSKKVQNQDHEESALPLSLRNILKAHGELVKSTDEPAPKKKFLNDHLTSPPLPSIDFFLNKIGMQYFSQWECRIMSMPLNHRWRMFLWQSRIQPLKNTCNTLIRFSIPEKILRPEFSQAQKSDEFLTNFWHSYYPEEPAVFEEVKTLEVPTLLEKFAQVQKAQHLKLKSKINGSKLCQVIESEFSGVMEKLNALGCEE